MRNLIVTMVLVLMAQTTVNAAVECEKKGRFWYPKNDTAKTIADSLRVKTCNGERFKEVVAKLGETSNVKTKPKRLTVDELVKKMKGNK